MSDDLSTTALDYVLGALPADERAVFSQLAARDPDARAALAYWERKFAPMAAACFDQLQTRAPEAAGSVVTDFVIVGDEHVGGVVDEVTLQGRDDAAVLGDDAFHTCLRESMMAMVFRPPPRGGSLRVRYPFRFAPGDGGAPDASPR